MYLDYFFLFLLVDIEVVEYMEIVITGQIVCFVSLSRSVNFVPVQYQSKFFIYYVTRHKDYSVFHELCD